MVGECRGGRMQRREWDACCSALAHHAPPSGAPDPRCPWGTSILTGRTRSCRPGSKRRLGTCGRRSRRCEEQGGDAS